MLLKYFKKTKEKQKKDVHPQVQVDIQWEMFKETLQKKIKKE